MLSPVLAVVTNIDADHLANYGGDFARVRQAFDDFLHRLPFYGTAVLCIDDAEVAELAQRTPRGTVTYGTVEKADVRATCIVQQGARTRFDLHLPGRNAALAVDLADRFLERETPAEVRAGYTERMVRELTP